MKWKRTASLTLSQTTPSGSSLIGAEIGTSRLPNSPRYHPAMSDGAVASGPGGTTPARWGRLPSCREDKKRRSGILPSRCFLAAASPRCCFLRGTHQGERGSSPHPASSRPPPPRRPPRCGIRRAPGFPLPHSGIEGIPAAAGRILRLAERPQAAARGHPARFRGGILPPSLRRRRGCRDRDGRPRRRLRVAARLGGAPLPRRRLSGAHPQPRSPRAASAPQGISWAASPRHRPRASSAEQPVPGCGFPASCRCGRRHRAAAMADLAFGKRYCTGKLREPHLPASITQERHGYLATVLVQHCR